MRADFQTPAHRYQTFVSIPAVFLFCGILTLVSTVSQAAPIQCGTGMAVGTAGSLNVAVLASSATQMARASFGAGSPKIIFIYENFNTNSSTILSTIKTEFGSSVPIAGLSSAWPDYLPYTAQQFASTTTQRGLAIMALGGGDFTVQVATGDADFSSTDPAVLQMAGTRLAQRLSPVAGKNNLLIIDGPMHTPYNQYVVAGIESVFGTPLPSNLKIIGGAGESWSSPVYYNGVLLSPSKFVVGALLSGSFNWAFSGEDQSDGLWTNPPDRVAYHLQKIVTELGAKPEAVFCMVGHPDISTWSAIRSTATLTLGSSTDFIGHIGGSETGHYTTAGDVVPAAGHFFAVGIRTPGADNPQPPVAPKNLRQR